MLKVYGIGGIIGGVLRVATSFVTNAADPDLLELLYVVTDFGLILGLLGIYLVHRESLAPYGHAGFIIALCAFSFIAGPDAEIFGVSAYRIGTPVIGVGIIAFAASQLRSASYPNSGAVTLIASIVVGGIALVLPAYPAWFATSGVLFGIGFVINGVYVCTNGNAA